MRGFRHFWCFSGWWCHLSCPPSFDLGFLCFYFWKQNKQTKNQDWQKLCMKNCRPLRSNLHAFILCFQWTASLYAIEKQLSQGFCISLHTSINNNENTNASYTTLDQMLINVYFHLRWLKNKKKLIKHSKLLYAHIFQISSQPILFLDRWIQY